MAAALKTYIRQAFNQGQIVWLDEINSIIETIDPQQNENLQRWMKAFLSGLDPDTQKPAEKPGFMLMVTANSIGKKGRSLLGPSIRGHLRKYDIPDPNEADFLTLCQKKLPDLSANAQEELARDLHYLCQEEPDLTLREIAPQLNQYGEIYRQPYEQDNAPYPLNNCLSG